MWAQQLWCGEAQSMDDAIIVQSLEVTCDNDNLIFQVIQELPDLYIYVNRVEEQALDYEVLTQQIYGVVTTLPLEGVTGLGIFSRPCDQPEPDWQIFLDLDLGVDPEVEADSGELSFPETSLTETNVVETALLAEPEATIEVIQEEVKAEPDVEQTPPPAQPVAIEPIDPAEPAKTLADYCFIRNKALITAKVLPPDVTIAKLVQFFDNLPAAQQLELLPVLETYLLSPNPELVQPFDAETQAWLTQLGQLKDMDARNITIWLSRYCHNPTQTMTELSAVLTNKSPVPEPSTPTTNANAADHDRGYSANSNRPPNPSWQEPEVEADKPSSRWGVQTVKMPREWSLMIAIGWFFFTLITITLAMRSLDPTRITNLACIKSSDAPMCALALRVTGAATFEDSVPDKRFPFSFEEKQQATNDCQMHLLGGGRPPELQEEEEPGLSRMITPPILPKVANNTEVLSGLLLVDLQNDHPEQPGRTLRTACTFAKTEAAGQPKLVGFDQIPVDWPKTPYQRTRPDIGSMLRAFGVFGIFVTLGAGTLFTAMALQAAAQFRLGIEIDSLESLGMAAFCLGIIETVTQFLLIPAFGFLGIFGGFFGWIAIQSLGLWLTSLLVKGFRVQWERGYWVIAVGVILINIVRFILNLILLISLASIAVF
jgi:uncharacterized membrane protein YvlD (DUF360 family)